MTVQHTGPPLKTLEESLLATVHSWALNGIKKRSGSTHWPLSVSLDRNKPDDWWGTKNGPKRREGVVATVHCNRNWLCSVIGNPGLKQKHPIVYVSEDAKVIVVRANG